MRGLFKLSQPRNLTGILSSSQFISRNISWPLKSTLARQPIKRDGRCQFSPGTPPTQEDVGDLPEKKKREAPVKWHSFSEGRNRVQPTRCVMKERGSTQHNGRTTLKR
ncbi:hypothetical protein Pmani_020015 [Petrolisthes manimaculis]|uniref:Uncharacterized protein n=1 Tax=Petrolisthes manimaculis TaxID=1843537 RepID=A0AAE1PIH4_9EUCA|nr:hypothetical protein Pmani_020015 [Petrolisthes manimaculis]